MLNIFFILVYILLNICINLSLVQWGKVEEKDTQITNIIFPIQFKSKLLIGLTTDIATSVPNIVVQSINTNYTNKNMEILHANISDAFFFMVLGI